MGTEISNVRHAENTSPLLSYPLYGSHTQDDVIINGVELGHPQRWRQIASDEAYARDLQAQFDQESPSLDQRYPPSTHLWSSTGVSSLDKLRHIHVWQSQVENEHYSVLN